MRRRLDDGVEPRRGGRGGAQALGGDDRLDLGHRVVEQPGLVEDDVIEAGDALQLAAGRAQAADCRVVILGVAAIEPVVQRWPSASIDSGAMKMVTACGIICLMVATPCTSILMIGSTPASNADVIAWRGTP